MLETAAGLAHGVYTSFRPKLNYNAGQLYNGRGGRRGVGGCLGGVCAHTRAHGPGSRPRQQREGRQWAPRATSVGETAPGAAPGSDLMVTGPPATRAAHAGAHAALGHSRPVSAHACSTFRTLARTHPGM